MPKLVINKSPNSGKVEVTSIREELTINKHMGVGIFLHHVEEENLMPFNRQAINSSLLPSMGMYKQSEFSSVWAGEKRDPAEGFPRVFS